MSQMSQMTQMSNTLLVEEAVSRSFTDLCYSQ